MGTPQLWLAPSRTYPNSHAGQLGLEQKHQEVAHTICWAKAGIWGLLQTITVESWKWHAMSSQHVVPSVVCSHGDHIPVSPSLAYYDPASPASQDEVKATLGVYQAWYDRGVAASLTHCHSSLSRCSSQPCPSWLAR